MSVCEKIKKILKDSGINYVKAAEILGTNNVAVGKYLWRGPMNLKRLVLFADMCGYDVVLKNKYGEKITIDADDVGRGW